MSYTEIYKFNKKGDAECFAEVRNSYRGAMAVWNIMEERYLPPFIPQWAIRLDEDLDKRYHRAADMTGKALNEVWELFNDPNVSVTDKIVIGTTFDNVTVKREDLPRLIEEFRKFEGDCSLKEQADKIEKELNDDPDFIAIAWNQTSVNYGTWDSDKTHIDEDGEEIYLPYNILKEEKHWNLFDEISK